MTLPLPYELLSETVRYCDNDTLTRCAPANRTFLELARSHLYYQLLSDNRSSVISSPHLLTHTRYIARGFFSLSRKGKSVDVVPVLLHIIKEGKLQGLDFYYFAITGQCCDEILEITTLPSFTWLSVAFGRNAVSWLGVAFGPNALDYDRLLPLLTSPKLRDLDLLHHTQDFESDPINHLVTFRENIVLWEWRRSVALNFSHLQKLALVVPLCPPWHFIEDLEFMLTEASGTLLHLSLFLMDSQESEGYDLVPFFIPIQQLNALKSFRLQIPSGYNCQELNSGLDLIDLLLCQLSVNAPLEEIHLYIHIDRDSTQFPPRFAAHPRWDSFNQTLSTLTHSNCRLMVHLLKHIDCEVVLPHINKVSSCDIGRFGDWELGI